MGQGVLKYSRVPVSIASDIARKFFEMRMR